ncbi:hypothetical protein SBA3_2300026 [Candidatus Sulfopaludibacter sp. SbA3]|nr:hypothetical protein SBA3_2300026 [Candidatus Sulfopaludibacter sp. SbA3]
MFRRIELREQLVFGGNSLRMVDNEKLDRDFLRLQAQTQRLLEGGGQ